MEESDLRWKQRLGNFKTALAQLQEAVALKRQRPLSPLETQGLIKAFEFTHELAWNVMKDFFAAQGTLSLMGSRDATREAFQKGLSAQGDLWMEMIKSRNLSSHTYHQAMAQDVVERVTSDYIGLLNGFAKRMDELSDGT